MKKYITGRAFIPDIGKCYEVDFGNITINHKTCHITARIKVNGIHYSQWIDLNTGRTLDQNIAAYVVLGFMEIPCE